MSTAGEAASLFGSPDAAADPFTPSFAGDAALDSQAAVSDLFGADAGGDFLTDGAGSLGVGTGGEGQQTWYDNQSQSAGYGNNAAASGYAPQQLKAQPNGYHAQEGTYQHAPSVPNSPAYGTYGAAQQYTQAPPTQSYASYAPTTTSAHPTSTAPQAAGHAYGAPTQSYAAPAQAYAPPAQTYGAPAQTYGAPAQTYGTPAQSYGNGATQAHASSTHAYGRGAQAYGSASQTYGGTAQTHAPSQQAYGAYAPATNAHDPYAPAAPVAPAQTQASAYSAYTPAAHPVNSAPPALAPPGPSIPPPESPKVTVAPYRPKTSNAYDPPIPARKTSKFVAKSPPPVYAPSLPHQPISPALAPPRGPSRGAGPHHAPPQQYTHAPAHAANGVAHPPPPVHGAPHPHGGHVAPSHAAQPPQPNGYNATLGGPTAHQPARVTSPPKSIQTSPPRSQLHTFHTADDELTVFGEPGDTYGSSTELHHPPAPANKTPQTAIFLGASHFASAQAQHDPQPLSPPQEIQETATSGSSDSNVASPASDGAKSPPTRSIPSSSPPPVHPASDPYAPPAVAHSRDTYAPTRPQAISDPYAPTQSQPTSEPYAPYQAQPTSDAYAASQARQASDPYAPSDHPARTQSPGSASIRSVSSIHSQDPPRRSLTANTYAPPVARPLSSQSRRSTLSNAYDPPTGPGSIARTGSPLKHSIQPSYDPYAPAEKSNAPSQPHMRTSSSGSTLSVASASHDSPYAPPRHPVRQTSDYSYNSFAAAPESTPQYGVPTPSNYEQASSQVVTLAPTTHSMYAPSPSLLGTNDPLGRTSARAPVVSFGFGGKLVTCFHGAAMSAGFDVALSSRQTTDIKIEVLHKVIPESALDTSTSSYPGPLFSDPGSPTASLVRTGASAALKTKKAKVVKYLEERAEEITHGLGYHDPGSQDQRRAEAKRTLVVLLKAMVEHDGKLTGSPEVEAAVRAALVPSLEDAGVMGDSLKSSSSTSLPRAADLHSTSSEFSAYGGMGSALPSTNDHTITSTTLRSSHLDKIQNLLSRGDRRGACHYAADQRLWAHALVIASSVDKECWREVVTEFVRAELAPGSLNAGADGLAGREPLRVAYSLYGGNGGNAIQELVQPSTLLNMATTLQIPAVPTTITPLSPSFPLIQPMNVTDEVLATWAQTACMILSSPVATDSSAALTALGDQLMVHQWIEAAHSCYLLSPQTAPLGGLGSAGRAVLLGGPSPNTFPLFHKDPDPIVFSEIAEFAMSLAPPAKGQEAFGGLPHLQPYRLLRATALAEIGHVALATRYCEAISASMGRNSPYLNYTFFEQLKGLSDRLIAAPQLDKSASWIGGKVAKPSLDSIGNWLEGRFTKFIAGEGDSPSASAGPTQQTFGPFAHYSTISSAETSMQPSPHQSVTDLAEVASQAPPFRTGSALAVRSSTGPAHLPINRASSAMDHVRPFHRKGSPVARVASATGATFADAASYGQRTGPYGNGYPAMGNSSQNDVSPERPKPPPTGTWWGASESDVRTPTASTFLGEDDTTMTASTSGFISLMDDNSLSMTPTATKERGSPVTRSSSQSFADDDDDDLGLGNSSSRPKSAAPPEGDKPAAAEQKKPAEPAKPEVRPAASGGWLSKLWKRDSTPGPVKANLGEQSAFYYDEELKRWVNKNAAPEPPKSAPPAPPPRSQTASPGRAMGGPGALGPPPRPATSHASAPPKPPPARVRSNLVPDDVPNGSSTPPPPPGTPPPGGPPAGGKSTGRAKKPARSRYVDVFQQDASAGGLGGGA